LLRRIRNVWDGGAKFASSIAIWRMIRRRAANLSEANLIWADLDGANLSEAKLSGADLSGAVLFKTIFSNVDLTGVIGLETCNHKGPSTIDHRTLQISGQLPLPFLRGVGLPDRLIEYLP
jgi:uncharacterized protein YjbI with pentapeptide repeats